MEYTYSGFGHWYEGCYKDKHPCCSAGRPFSFLHQEKTNEAWLLVHGFRGYPGELVYPGKQLFEAEFDVFAVRLPGHGTSGRDFQNTDEKDWLHFLENAIRDLKSRYRKVHLLGHSMGTSLVAILGAPDSQIGKIVYAAPSFENRVFNEKEKQRMQRLLHFKKRERCRISRNLEYCLHYENAPCDSDYLCREYWRWTFFRQLLSLDNLIQKSMDTVEAYPHESLILCPMLDRMVSVPGTELFIKRTGRKDQVVYIENGSHFLFYDKNPEAEQKALEAVINFAKK